MKMSSVFKVVNTVLFTTMLTYFGAMAGLGWYFISYDTKAAEAWTGKPVTPANAVQLPADAFDRTITWDTSQWPPAWVRMADGERVVWYQPVEEEPR